MGKDADLSLAESVFVHAALAKDLRTDGRAMYETRAVKLVFGSELGWVDCSLGSTRVIAQVSAEIVQPLADRPYEGFLAIQTEITPLAGAAYEAGRQSEEEVVLTRMLEKALRKSNAVDREALCIVAGQRVWSIKVDLHFLNDEGNLIDCATLAAMTALRHFRRPDVTVVGEDVTIHSITERVPIPLAIHHTPLCLTFAFFGETAMCVLDPSLLESALSSGTITLTLNAQQEICVLTKAGGTPLDVEVIMKVVLIGTQRVRELDEKLKAALARDASLRIVSVR